MKLQATKEFQPNVSAENYRGKDQKVGNKHRLTHSQQRTKSAPSSNVFILSSHISVGAIM